MKLILPILIFLLVFFSLHFYLSRTLIKIGISSSYRIPIIISSIVLYIIIIGTLFYLGRHSSNFTFVTAVFLLLLVPQLVNMIFGIVGDLVLLATSWIGSPESVQGRRRFVGTGILAIAAIPFAGLLHGIFYGKYNFKLFKHTLSFSNLPLGFEDYKIVHISDIHVGSLDNKEKIREAVEMAKSQNPDLLLFTGDLVNHTADEVDGWEDILGDFKAKDGMYAVLGNHDYAPYLDVSESEKEMELNKTKNKYKELGFELLNNENITLEKSGDKVKLLGVEYWGNTMKDSPGDLEKALVGVDKGDFKILMSHDPSHVEKIVFPHEFPFELSLSGHTHGMQFGIEIPGWIKWSPIQYVYKFWAGMYQENGQFLNVNRGFGFHAYAGRTGIWPEISVLTLKRTV